MQLTEIERQPLKQTSAQVLNQQLAEEASLVLGYTRMATERIQPLKPLAAKLAELELDVLNIESVHSYQLEHWKTAVNERLGKWLREARIEDSLPSLPSWRQTKIEDYQEAIPEFVLAKAIAIKKALPKVVLVIEALEDYPDPFLMAAIRKDGYYHVNEEEYYIEAWQEPGFEGKLFS